jgi:predicted 2-oxoglutarate/Fe(II)-dependent dioxygenase YbiX
MSAILGAVAPGVFKDFQLYSLPKEAQRQCGAWAACVINNGGNNPNQTEVHCDVKESQFGYSCVVSCGDYSGGDIVLYDLHCKLELLPGDLLLFPDSLIHHSNEEAQGTRKSMVTFTEENVNDYWFREFGMRLKRKIRKAKKTEMNKKFKKR